MTTLTRTVHAATARFAAADETRRGSTGLRGLSSLGPRDSSQVTGVVVEVLGEQAAAVELERTGAGQFREEIVVHGQPGWTSELTPGARVHATGEWELADWHQWTAGERAHYLAIRGRLEFRVHAVQILGAHSVAA
ncbi:hypothetical protein [Kocuria sp.]|uniref:hypothetical protein n=1 Tax=Kocuria sp. TaxID=1871328 RepID=UPI0026DFA86D|nr:hypothetical protein [Kocuria sp.]MDO5619169.1 hypothetical protein [Kocuria sp.]